MFAPAEQIADGNLLKSTHHGFLDVPGHGSMIAHVFPQLRGSLLSISKLVNFGLKVLYCSDFVTGFDKHDKPVFQGNRDVHTGLWMVDLRSLSTAGSAQAASENTAYAAVRLDSAADFVNFWHATFGSPSVSTFIAAIDKGFIRVLGLTAAKVRRNTPNPVATAYGHLHATRKGIKSTTPKVPPFPTTKPISDENNEPISAPRERRVWCQVDDVRVGRAHSDATGALSQRGRTGALYQIVFYH